MKVSGSRLGVSTGPLLAWWDLGEVHGLLSAIFGLVGHMSGKVGLSVGGKHHGTEGWREEWEGSKLERTWETVGGHSDTPSVAHDGCF